jgi:hypothetical protein
VSVKSSSSSSSLAPSFGSVSSRPPEQDGHGAHLRRMNMASWHHGIMASWHHPVREQSVGDPRLHSLTLQTPAPRRYRRGTGALFPLGLPYARRRASRVVPPQHASAVPRPDRGAETLRECAPRDPLAAPTPCRSCSLVPFSSLVSSPRFFVLHIDLPYSVFPILALIPHSCVGRAPFS